MKEQLIHILDQSVCLSRKQMKEYLNGAMLPEEMHAAEVHLSACPLCNMAMEGFQEHSEAALTAIASLNSGFLKEHFANISPQIHLNSMAPTMAASEKKRKHISLQPMWRVATVAAAALLIFGILWAFERNGRSEKRSDSGSYTAMNGTGGAAKGDAETRQNGSGTNPSASSSASQGQTGDATTPSGAVNPVKNETHSTTGTNSGSASVVKQQASGTASTTEPNRATNNAAAVVATQSAASGATTAAKSKADASPAALAKNVGNNDAGASEATHVIKEYIPDVTTTEQGTAATITSNSVAVATPDKTVNTTPTVARKQLAAAPVRPATTPSLMPISGNERSQMELGDEAMSTGNYNAALAHYKNEVNNPDVHLRYQAKISSAECYVRLHKKAKAEELLENVIKEGPGAERRAARRALRHLR